MMFKTFFGLTAGLVLVFATLFHGTALADSLVDAAGRGDVPAVVRFLGLGARVNQPDKTGKSALFRAARGGHADVVKLLLSYGADPSQADSQGMTPLAAAVQNNHPDIAVLLSGASPLLAPESLLDAARNGDYKRVRSFLANGYRVNVADAHGFTALFEAAQGGHADVVKLLLDHKADPNQAVMWGKTPLQIASFNGDADLVKLLLDRGADPNRTDMYGRTPLIEAAQGGHAHAAQLLLERGADPNQADKDGRTPLLFAAENGHSGLVKILLDRGADPNRPDKYGTSPLQWAEFNKHPEASALIEAAMNDPAFFLVAFLDRIPNKDRSRLREGDLIVGASGTPSLFHGKLPEEDRQRLYALLLEKDRDHLDGPPPTKPSPPPPPHLVQGEFESTKTFDARVEKARKDYSLAAFDYRRKLRDYKAKMETRAQSYPQWRKNAILELLLNARIGAPSVASVAYDPDAQIFSVVLGGPFGGQYLLTKTVPNDKAPAFDNELKRAEPSLHFSHEGNRLVLESATFSVAGQSYTALPSKTQNRFRRNSVDIAGLSVQESGNGSPSSGTKGENPDLSDLTVVRRSGNPKIAKLLEEIKKARDQNREESEIDRLKQRLAFLRHRNRPEIHSSVDRPDFRTREKRNAYAVVVGVESYPGGLPKAEFAVRDAKAVYRTLVALGVPPDHIRLLTDDTATRGRIRGAIRWLRRNAGNGSDAWFYFSGHGAPDDRGSAYLVPFGGDPTDLEDTGYSQSALYRELDRLPARHVLVALDACFTGQGRRSVLGKGTRPLVTKIREGLLPPSGPVIVFSAARADQEAGILEKEGHGVFTYYFLRGLDKGAVKNGHVTVGALYRYLKPKVRERASLDNRNQTPELEPRALEQDAAVRLR